ncbi:coiled-coil domain-containing protein 7-like [Sciurus carolinensis]|uniref:coiled-coil domain-containing protein 7-like n=1 Tax=Sciurus carolinensis TaxID=30640 RepID=UPI001FB4B478|nr:coiled-coil domain-containing protein 7-like [Sciurus carolinensis]
MKTKSMRLLETDPERLKDALKQHLLKSDFRTPPVNLPEIDPEYLRDGFKQPLLKSEYKTLPVDIPGRDGSTRAIERGKNKGESKIQIQNPPETNIQFLTDIKGKGLIIKDEMKTKSMSHPGVNLSKGKDMLTQEEDRFVKHTAPSKSLTKSPMYNQVTEIGKSMANLLTEGVSGVGLHKRKDTFIQHRENTHTKKIRPTKFPMKVVTLSPFINKVF